MALFSLSNWTINDIQAVIFDMDGVLINSEPIYFAIEQSSFRHFGAVVGAEEHHRYVGVTLESMWRQVLDKHRLGCTLEQALSYHKQNVMNTMLKQEGLRAMPHLERWLSWLASNEVPIAVASSSPKELINLIMEKSKLGQYFKVRVSGEEVRRGKPAPDIFLHAAQRLGVTPAACIVVEDSTNGVQAAKNAGMRCIGYQNPDSGSQNLSLADLLITDYQELGWV